MNIIAHLLFALFSFLLLFSSGCATSLRTVDPVITPIDFPKIGEEVERELGETLVDYGNLMTLPAIQTESSYTAHWGLGGKIVIPPAIYPASTTSSGGTSYLSQKRLVAEGLLGSAVSEVSIFIPSTSTNRPSIVFSVGQQVRAAFLPKDFKYKMTTSEDFLPGTFRQELIYNGRSGDTVKFLYREIQKNALRYPFNQEVSYDLREGKTVGFKGARLDIISATNTRIKYRVLKSFIQADREDGVLQPSASATTQKSVSPSN
jgi:hypothetical protein